MSLEILENYDITPFNTFGVKVHARYFARISMVQQLVELDAIKNKNQWKPTFLCLGEGSNVLFTQNYPDFVLKIEMGGVEIIKETDQSVQLKVGAGENWHQFVLNGVNRGWGGIENLSLIPGTVGAAPIQNIGAYGVEVKDVIDGVEFYDLKAKQIKLFMKDQCEFSYRDSIFKKQGRGQWIITAVYFNLSKKPQVNTSYGVIQAELQKRSILQPTIKDLSDVVIDIRRSKLPDPKSIGNAGSFFKNPIISKEHFARLKALYPEIAAYPESTGQIKVAAGWLIDQCGLKGWRQGACGIHAQQALVLVNYGGATGSEILHLAEFVQSKVLEKFQVSLETEVQVI